MNEPKPLPSELVERLLSGNPTPLEREAGEALASLADELRLAREDAKRYRFIRLEDNHAAVEAVNHFFGPELDAAIDAALQAPHRSRD